VAKTLHTRPFSCGVEEGLGRSPFTLKLHHGVLKASKKHLDAAFFYANHAKKKIFSCHFEKFFSK